MSTATAALEVAGTVVDENVSDSLEYAIWAGRDWADLDRALAAVAAACHAGDVAADRAEKLALWAAAVSRQLPECTCSDDDPRICMEDLLPGPGDEDRHCPCCLAPVPANRAERPVCERCHPSPDVREECRVAA